MTWRLVIGAIALFAATGCDGIIGSVDTPPGSKAAPEVAKPQALPDPGVATHTFKRLSVPQLIATFPVVFGNDLRGTPINWTIGPTSVGFAVRDGELGEPDFFTAPVENRDVSFLYAKLLDDAARDACSKVLTADFARTDATTRAFLRHVDPKDTIARNAAGVDQNLRYLRLRFHGVRLASDDTAGIERLRTLFSDASGPPGGPREGWRAVCMALVTAPDFNLF